MKSIISLGFGKVAKSKYPKSETEPYNPWAVCTESVGRDDDKYERCVHHLKDKNKDDNKGKDKDKAASLGTEKPVGSWNPNVMSPDKEDQFVDETQGTRLHRFVKKPGRALTWEEVQKRMEELKVRPQDLVASGKRKFVVMAKKKSCCI